MTPGKFLYLRAPMRSTNKGTNMAKLLLPHMHLVELVMRITRLSRYRIDQIM